MDRAYGSSTRRNERACFRPTALVVLFTASVVGFRLLTRPGFAFSLCDDQPRQAAAIRVSPGDVILENSRDYSGFRWQVLHAYVKDDEGNPVPWTEVRFELEDSAIVSFPYPVAFTDGNGVATTVLDQGEPTVGVGVITRYRVFAGMAHAGPFGVIQIGNVEELDQCCFQAPPLKPFQGSRQELLGNYGVGGLGCCVEAWSVDPTIAEPGPGEVVALNPTIVRFNVIGRRVGETAFILQSSDPYVAVVTGEPNPVFLRGDTEGDGKVDLSDAVGILGYLFLGERAPECAQSADVNDDAVVEITDAILLLSHLFLGGPPPCPPYPAPGDDPTVDALGC